MFDNEIKSGKKKPVGKFLNHVQVNDENKEILTDRYMINIIENLYLLTVPLIGGKDECDIEDLFDEIILSQKIEGKEFSKEDKYDVSKYYGKEIFSKYILNNYTNINFDAFKPILDNINKIIGICTTEPIGEKSDLNIKNEDENSARKIPIEV